MDPYMKPPSAALALDPRGRAYLLAWNAWQRGEREIPSLSEFMSAPAPPPKAACEPPPPSRLEVKINVTVDVRIKVADD
jgi:hypothetical protein